MLSVGVLLFSVLVVPASLQIARRATSDQGKTAAFTALIAWGSLFYGLVLARTL